jgi:acyl-coenzyme A synthetase/AMP-(fatty) acid ligase
MGALSYRIIAPGGNLPEQGDIGNFPDGCTVVAPSIGSEGELVVNSSACGSGQITNRTQWERIASGDSSLATGDIVFRTSPDSASIVGRRAEFIKSAGYRVNPREIESLVTEKIPLEAVAVIGVEHEALEEEIVLVAETQDIAGLLPQLRAVCREHLCAHKVPRRYIGMEKLPRTRSGKILRHSWLFTLPFYRDHNY